MLKMTNSMELTRERCGNRQEHHKDSKARICMETPESRNKLLNVSRSKGEM